MAHTTIPNPAKTEGVAEEQNAAVAGRAATPNDMGTDQAAREKEGLLDQTTNARQSNGDDHPSCCSCVKSWVHKNKKAVAISGSLLGTVGLCATVWWLLSQKPGRRP